MTTTLIGDALIKQMQALCSEITQLPDDEAIEVINAVKMALHQVSPLKNEPVDCVVWVKADQVEANDYNPNVVAPPEMKLL